MIECSTGASTYMMTGLAAAIDSGGAGGYVRMYDGVRPAFGAAPTGDLIVECGLAFPCGTTNGSGQLVFSPGLDGTVVKAAAPTWGRVFNSVGAVIFDCNTRLSTDPPDPVDPEELVVTAPSLSIGSLIRVSGGYVSGPTP